MGELVVHEMSAIIEIVCQPRQLHGFLDCMQLQLQHTMIQQLRYCLRTQQEIQMYYRLDLEITYIIDTFTVRALSKRG